MNRSKRKTDSHITGEQAVKFVKSLLPIEWTVRELVPDYGIDLQIELFEKSTMIENWGGSFDTLGEYLYVQVKGTKKIKTKKLTVKSRHNVELKSVSKGVNSQVENDIIKVAVFNIETSELVTVQRMGAAIPVLLFLVDIAENRLFYICLNDYIDKILLPENPKYYIAKTKTIYIPLKNEISSDKSSLDTMRFYAKRPKFYAAFQKFSYQTGSMKYVYNESLIETAQYFANILLRYDFWTQDGLWHPMKRAHEHLRNLVITGNPRLFESTNINNNDHQEEDEEENWTTLYSGNRAFSEREIYVFMQIRALWDQLENLGAMYEEICREWSLPTSLGVVTSDL